MNTFALMQVQVDGSPDEIASISGFDFSQILDDPQDENIEDLIVLTLLRNYFATISMSHQALPLTDPNPNATQMLYGLVLDSSVMEGHTEGSASLVCFNERILKDLLSADLQLGEEARDLPLEEFIELARPHLPPSLEIIQNPITLRVVRATLAPPLPPLMPTALMDSSPSNYIDVFDIIKEKISNREDVLEGSHTVAKYYPDGDYIEFVAECGLYFGMEETGDCTPSNVLFTSDALDNADGNMTARYRINGGAWENYSAEPYQGVYSLAKDFLSGLVWNDWRLFADGGGGYAAFIFHYRNSGFSGVYKRLEDNDNGVMEIVNPELQITIDFQVTSGDEYDIVWKLFGEDTTVHSCAIANFAGV